MKRNGKQPGLTLIEMMVVIAIVALLVSISMPALRQLMDSTATEGTVRGMIAAAMASARAIAAREQRYAGIRFQQDLDGRQYMIFIVHDFNETGLANGFRAVGKLTPIELPDTIGVMDLRLGSDGDKEISSEADITLEWQLRDTTSFSVIFSPSGKLVIHNVRVWNRDGTPKWPDFLDNSQDDIFNTKTRVESGIGMFIQDDYDDPMGPYGNLGLGQELSRRSFVIYDKTVFEKLNPNSRYDDYLKDLEVIYINSYTGTLISTR